MRSALIRIRVLASLLVFCHALPVLGRQSAATATNLIVPPLVQVSGVLTDVNGKPLTELTGVTFGLYKDSQGGAPLWVETQNVEPNKAGHYSVMSWSVRFWRQRNLADTPDVGSGKFHQRDNEKRASRQVSRLTRSRLIGS